ncbi:alpha/beta hydrolase [Rhodococcus sp. AB351]|uniref:alpha/beta hydrolase n=1 Tax=Rhodococcus TaxID=1827 RepID=UPI00132C3ABF|nr:alpha/beta hydrolase [Rhodococcus pyridinivorans]MXQ75884.1 alpha/beta hydrolase fold domain-containing protein [Rhodococcus rhodochrous]
MPPTPQLSPRVARTALRPLFRALLSPRWSFATQRRLLDLAAPLQFLPKDTVVRPIRLAGRPAERITVGATERTTAILYLHGGAYTGGSLATHRSLAAHLAVASGSAVYVLDYRLAPEYPYPAALNDAEAAYLELVSEHGFEVPGTAIAGDSAGGGLAAATTHRLIDRHGITPPALGLLSPWTDPAARDLPDVNDVVLNKGWVYSSAEAYLAGGDPTDPGYAPIHADPTGLPPTLIQVGTAEMFHPQVRQYAEKLRAAGVDVTLVEQPELWHVAPLQASLVPEAAAAISDFGVFLRDRMGTRAG